MNRHIWMKPFIAPLLGLVALLWGCDAIGPERSLTGPSQISTQLSSVDVDGSKLKIVKGKYDGKVRTDSKEISDKGGRLEAAGHVLIVPAGAVSVPTLFSMTLTPVDASGTQYIRVELSAMERDQNKNWTVDVGPRGFAVPVELRLTYSWMTDAVAASDLRTVWVKEDGTGEAFASALDSVNQLVISQLNHFSDYVLASP